jgi:hypothetical protein
MDFCLNRLFFRGWILTTSAEPEDMQTAEQPPANNGNQIQVDTIQDSTAVAIGRGAGRGAGCWIEKGGQPTIWDGRIPYLGLNAYQESDAEFFFGPESIFTGTQASQLVNIIVDVNNSVCLG